MAAHVLAGCLHFLHQLSCGHSQDAAAERADLHQRVGDGHQDGVVVADLGGKTFDVGIGSLPFFGVDHLDIVEL